ncbi:MAG: preprotein translocase subunit SecG [Chitinophagales bacterium]
MYIFIAVLIMIACVLLGLVVLVQNPKGGGLNQSMGGVSTQVFGAKNSTQLVEKVTWGLAATIVVLSLTSAVFINSVSTEDGVVGEQTQFEEAMDEGIVAPTTPVDLNTGDIILNEGTGEELPAE